MLALDVCADDSVATCVEAVLAGAGRLDVVVNHAGYELGGALEEASLDEAQAEFATNFFGVVRVVKAVLRAICYPCYWFRRSYLLWRPLPCHRRA